MSNFLDIIKKQRSKKTFNLGVEFSDVENFPELLNDYPIGLKEIEQEEAQIAQQLSDKYGKGSIDIETGEFTPSE